MIGVVVSHPDPEECNRISKALRGRGLQVYATHDLQGILDTARQARLCAILVEPGLLAAHPGDLRVEVRKVMGYHAPVIALTNVAHGDLKTSLLRHGASLLRMPVDNLVELADTLQELARRLDANPALKAKVSDIAENRSAEAPVLQAAGGKAGRFGARATILVVDDEATIRQFITEALKDEGYEVRAAAGGLDAVALLEKTDVDLIVSDLNMPDMDGFELKLAADRLRKRPVPFLFVTADASAANRENAEALGASAVLAKPIRSITELYAAVEKALAK